MPRQRGAEVTGTLRCGRTPARGRGEHSPCVLTSYSRVYLGRRVRAPSLFSDGGTSWPCSGGQLATQTLPVGDGADGSRPLCPLCVGICRSALALATRRLQESVLRGLAVSSYRSGPVTTCGARGAEAAGEGRRGGRSLLGGQWRMRWGCRRQRWREGSVHSCICLGREVTRSRPRASTRVLSAQPLRT